MKYEVKFSDRKTLSLSVKEERLIVRAPRGTSYEMIEKAVREHLGWIEKNMEKQRIRRENTPELTPKKISELRKLAKLILTQKTEKYAEIMGLKYGRITITGAKTRFGSCSSNGNIAFSYRLMMYPEEAIDYVVVHELSHLVEMNHSARFYSIVASVLPDYKRRRALLRECGVYHENEEK